MAPIIKRRPLHNYLVSPLISPISPLIDWAVSRDLLMIMNTHTHTTNQHKFERIGRWKHQTVGSSEVLYQNQN